MDMRSYTEKREYPRITLNRLVRVKLVSDKLMSLVGINYSMCGMALHSNCPLPLGEFIELQFRLAENIKQELSMTAEVMQNFRRGNVYITGVKFVGEIPPEALPG